MIGLPLLNLVLNPTLKPTLIPILHRALIPMPNSGLVEMTTFKIRMFKYEIPTLMNQEWYNNKFHMQNKT